jgi:AbrB family looped-hinge helix DNA binding protein
MKATGIVRRIDDLGRIVIPREIRKTLGITEGAALELFTHEGCICFKPYRDDEKKLAEYFETIATAMNKYSIKLALYVENSKVAGSHRLPDFDDDIATHYCGVRNMHDIKLGYDREEAKEANCEELLSVIAAIIQQKAHEIWAD